MLLELLLLWLIVVIIIIIVVMVVVVAGRCCDGPTFVCVILLGSFLFINGLSVERTMDRSGGLVPRLFW